METINKKKCCDMWCDMIETDTSYNIVKNNLDDSHMSKSITSIKSNLSNSLLVGMENPLANPIKFNIIIDHNLNNEQNLSVDEIIEINYKNISELSLLKNQSYVILQLKKYITSCKNEKIQFNKIMHTDKLKWLLHSILFLSDKHQLPKIIPNKKPNAKFLKRNSYEFCEKNNLCQYHITNKCKKKHFVYNFIACDIEELINYLEITNLPSIDEIYISINTVSYVLNHMKDEIYHLTK